MSQANITPLGSFPTAIREPATQLEPFDWYDRRRETGPVHYDEERRCWDVFDYDTVRAVSIDTERFSSNPRTHPENDDENLTPMARSMLFQDPPRHTQLRSVVDDFFRPGAVRRLEPVIERSTTALLDRAVDGADSESFDLVRELAYPLPVAVIAELLGVPASDRERFRAWSTAVVASSASPDGSGTAEQSIAASADLFAYFADLVESRRADPGEDLVSRILTATELTDEEILGFCGLLLVAGNVTTTNLITNAMWCFGEHDVIDRLQANPDDLEYAIEEVLRYRSPVQAMQRWATDDVTVGEHEVPAGRSIVIWLGAANRDPAAFDAADSFVPDRRPNRHVAFGHGIHHCLGASLARLEARIVLGTILDRLPDVEPELTALEPSGSMMIYGCRSLPIRYSEVRPRS